MPASKKPAKTARQKSQKAQMNIVMRLIGVAWLIYTVFNILTTAPEDSGVGSSARIALAIVFLCASAVIIAITIAELVRNLKAGAYAQSFYSDDATIAESDVEDPDTPE